jgi:hypothetical protein
VNRRPNPFQVPARPIPCAPYAEEFLDDHSGDRAPWVDHNLFTEDVVVRVLERNHAWLRDRARSTSDVKEALFPRYEESGMRRAEILSVLNRALFDLGYHPSHTGSNPKWSSPVTA